MNPPTFRFSLKSCLKRISACAVAVIVFSAFADSAIAQPAELSLADLLIGLRSKKAPLEERNKILTEAIGSRGVTFSLTPEIEKELAATGAEKRLIDSIRSKQQMTKVAAVQTGVRENKSPEPPPPDFLFFEKRASANAALGNYDQAIADFTRAIEMNPGANNAYLERGGVYSIKKSFDVAIVDFSKVIENMPTNAKALAARAFAYENSAKLELAEGDYVKVAELEPENESAKGSAARVRAELNKIAESLKPKEVDSQPKPEFVSAGTLTEATATSMIKPAYSQLAARTNIGGKVVVEVTLDEAGNVIDAKAVSGHAMLRWASVEAAKRSKFKPVLFKNQPSKAKGTIIYNFVTKS